LNILYLHIYNRTHLNNTSVIKDLNSLSSLDEWAWHVAIVGAGVWSSCVFLHAIPDQSSNSHDSENGADYNSGDSATTETFICLRSWITSKCSRVTNVVLVVVIFNSFGAISYFWTSIWNCASLAHSSGSIAKVRSAVCWGFTVALNYTLMSCWVTDILNGAISVFGLTLIQLTGEFIAGVVFSACNSGATWRARTSRDVASIWSAICWDKARSSYALTVLYVTSSCKVFTFIVCCAFNC
jgi:hypothetical protein